MPEGDAFTVVFLEGGQLFLNPLALDLVLEVFVLLDRQGQFVQGIEVAHCHYSILSIILSFQIVLELHAVKAGRGSTFLWIDRGEL